MQTFSNKILQPYNLERCTSAPFAQQSMLTQRLVDNLTVAHCIHFLCKCAGSLPLEWFSSASVLPSSILSLDLGNNCLIGGIPQATGGNFASKTSGKENTTSARVTLDPMKTLHGLCGPIPSNMTVLSTQNRQLKGTMPAGPCPGVHLAYLPRRIGASCHVLNLKL